MFQELRLDVFLQKLTQFREEFVQVWGQILFGFCINKVVRTLHTLTLSSTQTTQPSKCRMKAELMEYKFVKF